jgi:hypothetical protein
LQSREYGYSFQVSDQHMKDHLEKIWKLHFRRMPILNNSSRVELVVCYSVRRNLASTSLVTMDIDLTNNILVYPSLNKRKAVVLYAPRTESHALDILLCTDSTNLSQSMANAACSPEEPNLFDAAIGFPIVVSRTIRKPTRDSKA